MIHTIKTVLTIVLVFALIYIYIDFKQSMNGTKTKYFEYNNVPNDTFCRKIFNKIYYSIITLTTIGFGDIYPIHPISQSITALQALIIYVLVNNIN